VTSPAADDAAIRRLAATARRELEREAEELLAAVEPGRAAQVRVSPRAA